MSTENWGSAPPDPQKSRAFWKLLDAAVKRADAHNEFTAHLIDEACFEYAATLSPDIKNVIAKRAREP